MKSQRHAVHYKLRRGGNLCTPGIPGVIFFLSVLPALAPKKPQLTKSRAPKPTNSAYAEFANQNAGSTGENAYQGGNRRTVPEFGKAEFCSFGTRRLHKAGRFRCQNASPLKFSLLYQSKNKIPPLA